MRASLVAGLLVIAFVARAEGPDASPPSVPAELPITAASPAARAAFSRGRALYYNLRTAEARDAFKEAVKLDPGCALAHIYLALSARPVASGKDAIDRALALRPKITEGERLLAEAVSAQLRGDVAEEDARREALAKLFPRDWRVLVARGNRLFHLGRYEDSIRWLEKAVQVAPDEAAPYNDLGYAYAYADRLDDAIRTMRKYADRLPSEPNPHDSLGEVLLKAGRAREAIASYERALAVDPKFVIANEGLGHARLLAGDSDGAREAYRRFADGAPTPYERLAGLDWLAAIDVYEGRLDDAIRSIERAEALAKQHKEIAWLTLFPARRALVLAETGRAREAVEAAKTATTASRRGLAPALAEELEAHAFVVLGAVHARTGNADGARKALASLDRFRPKKAGTTIDPKLAGALSALSAHVALASPSTETGTLETTGLEADPFGLTVVADALEHRGRNEEAAALRQRALKLNIVTPEFALVRARLLSGGSRVPGARVGPMPVTTSSTVALALFTDARRMGEAWKRVVAVAALEKAVELDPSFALARTYLALYTDDPETAATQLRAAQKLAADGRLSEGERLFVEAQSAGLDGDDATKEAKLAELVRTHPRDWRPLAYLGEHQLRIGRHVEAAATMKKATELTADEAYPWNGLGYALAFQNKFDDAITALKRYVELSPGESNPHDSLAEVLLLAGRPAESAAEYRRALDLSPQFVASWAGLGHARLFSGNATAAREAYREMTDRSGLSTERLEAYVWGATTWAFDGRFDEAAAALARAEAEADTAKDRLGAALLAARRVAFMAEAGRVDDGLALADHVLKRTRGKLGPATQVFVERLALFGRGWAELVAGKLVAAEDSAARLGKLAQKGSAESRAHAAALAGAVQLAQGKPAEALAAVKDADRRHPLVQAVLAIALERSGRGSESAALRSAIEKPTANHADLALARVWLARTK